MDDLNLIKKIKSGDKNAIEFLIKKYYQSVFSFFYKNTGYYHQSKDLTQEVFIKMVSGIARYQPKKNFKSWLFTIASNHLKNYYRTLSRHPEYTELSDEYAAIDNEIANIAIKSDVNAALALLPPEQRETIILRYYNDLSIMEIAKITGAKETTVKARIRYGLEKLKIELEDYNEAKK